MKTQGHTGKAAASTEVPGVGTGGLSPGLPGTRLGTWRPVLIALVPGAGTGEPGQGTHGFTPPAGQPAGSSTKPTACSSPLSGKPPKGSGLATWALDFHLAASRPRRTGS